MSWEDYPLESWLSWGPLGAFGALRGRGGTTMWGWARWGCSSLGPRILVGGSAPKFVRKLEADVPRRHATDAWLTVSVLVVGIDIKIIRGIPSTHSDANRSIFAELSLHFSLKTAKDTAPCRHQWRRTRCHRPRRQRRPSRSDNFLIYWSVQCITLFDNIDLFGTSIFDLIYWSIVIFCYCSFGLSIYWSIDLPIHQSIDLSIYQSIDLLIYGSIDL